MSNRDKDSCDKKQECLRNIFDLNEKVGKLETEVDNIKENIRVMPAMEKKVLILEQKITSIETSQKNVESATKENTSAIIGLSEKFDKFKSATKEEVRDGMKEFFKDNMGFRKWFIGILSTIIVAAVIGFAGYWVNTNYNFAKFTTEFSDVNIRIDSVAVEIKNHHKEKH